MSFTDTITEELLRIPLKKNCCRKALLLGLLCAARWETAKGEEETPTLLLRLYRKELATLAEDMSRKILHTEAALTETVRAGRRTYELRIKKAPLAEDFLRKLDGGTEESLHLLAGFRCAGCRVAFLRGLFCGTATVSDPTKGYHMEWTFPTEERADYVEGILSQTVGKPGRTRRGERYGCVYKSNGAISDLLCLMGCAGTGFAVANACIERDIRNYENRATNCVARNISRSVDASSKQRSAIEALIKTKKLERLPEELQYTAELRQAYPDATLRELALLHTPPITQSGLNRRLTRLIEAAEEE